MTDWVEDIIYDLIDKYDGVNFTLEEQEQIKKGIEIEMEHIDHNLLKSNPEEYKKYALLLSEWIARAHVFEIPDYYDRLKIMEEDAKTEIKAELKKVISLKEIKKYSLSEIQRMFRHVSIDETPSKWFFRIHEVREKLNLDYKAFNYAINYLANEGVIQLNQGNPSVLSPEEYANSLEDKKFGLIFITFQWID